MSFDHVFGASVRVASPPSRRSPQPVADPTPHPPQAQRCRHRGTPSRCSSTNRSTSPLLGCALKRRLRSGPPQVTHRRCSPQALVVPGQQRPRVPQRRREQPRMPHQREVQRRLRLPRPAPWRLHRLHRLQRWLQREASRHAPTPARTGASRSPHSPAMGIVRLQSRRAQASRGSTWNSPTRT